MHATMSPRSNKLLALGNNHRIFTWFHYQRKLSGNCSLTGRLHGTIVGPTGRSDWSVRPVGWSVYTFRSSDRLVGPTQATSDLSVRPVGPTGRTDCSRTAHICQSNQCGLLADYNTAYAAAWLVVRLAGRSDQSDVVSTRLDSRIGSRTKSNMFDSSDRLSARSVEAFTRYDRRTDQSDRPVGPTGRSDDRNV